MPIPSSVLAQILAPPRMRQPVLGKIVIRSTVEDFQVEEIPSYPLTGSGQHAWMWVEKRGITSSQMINLISSRLQIRGADVGLAGQKDRHAVTRQYVSVPARCAEAATKISEPQLKVLNVTLHKNRLKTGHHRGNRFRLTVRSLDGSAFSADDLQQVSQRMLELTAAGFPNYYGPQRFGHGGNTINEGLKLLQGRLPKDYWPENQSQRLRRLALSSVQSAVFNLLAGQRIAAGTAGTPVAGDVVIRRGGIKPFLWPQDSTTPDLLPAGPMFGPKMVAAADPVRTQEQECLQLLGLNGSEFTRFPALTSGARRTMLEFAADCSAQLNSDGSLLLQFSLSAGTYATTLLREIASGVQDSGEEQVAVTIPDATDSADRLPAKPMVAEDAENASGSVEAPAASESAETDQPEHSPEATQEQH